MRCEPMRIDAEETIQTEPRERERMRKRKAPLFSFFLFYLAGNRTGKSSEQRKIGTGTAYVPIHTYAARPLAIFRY